MRINNFLFKVKKPKFIVSAKLNALIIIYLNYISITYFLVESY
jgi:hypothetical protein